MAIADCVVGGLCTGTEGKDTITGSLEQDVILGLEGDDVIDPDNDAVADYVFGGPGLTRWPRCPKL